MADATRDVVIRLALETAEGSVRSVEKANKAVTDSYDHLLKKVEQTQKQLKDDAWAEEQQRQSQIAVDAAAKFGSSLMQVGEASLRAARGIIFLTAANEDDAAAMLKYVLAAQGVYDILRGTIQAVQALRTAYASLTAAMDAAAVAGGILQASWGAIGLALAGLGLAIGAAALAYRKLTDDAEESAERQIAAEERVRNARIRGAEGVLALRRRHGRVSIAEERAVISEAQRQYELTSESVISERAHIPAILGRGITAGESAIRMLETEERQFQEQIRDVERERERINRLRPQGWWAYGGHLNRVIAELQGLIEDRQRQEDKLIDTIQDLKQKQAYLETRLAQQTQ